MSGAVAALLRPVDLTAPAQGTLRTRMLAGTVGLAAQGLTRLLYSVLVARLAGDQRLGEVSGAISLALLAALFWPTATGSAVAKFVARERGAGSPERAAAAARLLRRRTAATAAVLAPAAAAAWLLPHFAGSAASAAGVGLLVLAWSGYTFTRGVQLATGQAHRAAAWDVLSALLALGALTAVLAGGREDLLLLPLAAGYALYAVANLPRLPRAAAAPELRREADAFTALASVGTLASTGFLQLSMVLAATLPGRGQYAAALQLATPAAMLSQSLSLVLFPTMAEAHGRGDETGLRARTDRATRGLFVTMTSVFGLLVVLAPLAVGVVFGAGYPDASRVLPFLLVAVLASTLSVAAVNSMTSRGTRGIALSAASSLLGLLVGAGAWAVLVGAQGRGVDGIALGYLAGALVVGLLPLGVVWRRDAHRWGDLAWRLALWVLLVAGCRVLAGDSVPAQLGLAAAFAAVWALVCRRELGALLRR
ncbi:hypothetical protein NUM3379_29610 [Kineococcus sp. NUM-3379]